MTTATTPDPIDREVESMFARLFGGTPLEGSEHRPAPGPAPRLSPDEAAAQVGESVQNVAAIAVGTRRAFVDGGMDEAAADVLASQTYLAVLSLVLGIPDRG